MVIFKDGQVEVAAVEARLSREMRRGDLAERRHVPLGAFERSTSCQQWVDGSILIKAGIASQQTITYM
ncbi:hypothetical protein NXC24_PC00404 (plasmid) [Rhizobium sp. NXC24]|nr:hypothetical protein NXC24_PC00404 [Rhizobium sp. NXC24]